MSNKNLTPEEMLKSVEADYDYLSAGVIVRISAHGAKRDLVKEAMSRYAAQEVAKKDALLKEAIYLLKRANQVIVSIPQESKWRNDFLTFLNKLSIYTEIVK